MGQDDHLTKVSSINKQPLNQSNSDDADTVPIQSRRLVDIDTTIPMKTYWERHTLWSVDSQAVERLSMWKQIYQPFQLLVSFPGVAFAALQYGFAIAMLAILAVTQSALYAAPPYNFSTAGIGNMNLPPAIGSLLGSLFGGPLVDYLIVQIAKRRGGIYEPETRLWLFLVPGLSMTIGCLMYGLTIAKVCASNWLCEKHRLTRVSGDALDYQRSGCRFHRLRHWRYWRYGPDICSRLVPAGKFFCSIFPFLNLSIGRFSEMP